MAREQRACGSFDGAGRCTKRVFVARQLDGVANAELALELLERLSRLIGRQLGDVRQNQRLLTHAGEGSNGRRE